MIMKYVFKLVLVLLVFSCGREANNSFQKSGIHQLRNGRMHQISSHDLTGGNNDRINIHQGDTAVILDRKGPGMITRIWFTIDSRDPDFLRNIILTAYWDNEETPSVWSPVGDFFGSPFEYRHFDSRNIGMTSGGYYCYFTMPYNEHSRIEIINQTDEEVYAFYYHINVYDLEEDFDENTGYFHALWNRNVRTVGDENYEALVARGRGQFVGLHYSGEAYDNRLVYLEGDEMIYVDGEQYPSTYGTGMEDYFNSGWYFQNGEFSADYHGLVLLDQENARVSAYRHHIPDAIPFREEIKVTLEHGHNNEEAVDISTVAFWYQLEPHDNPVSEMKPGLRKKLRRKVPNGVVEGESLISDELNATIADMTAHGPDWSDGAELQFRLKPGEEGTLTIDDLKDSEYNMDLYLTKGQEYGNYRIQTGNVSTSFLGLNPQIKPAEKITLENIATFDSKIDLTFVNTGNKESIFGLDAIDLTPIRKYIPEWYIIGPFDNPRDSDVDRYGIDEEYPPEITVDLNAVYKGKGL